MDDNSDNVWRMFGVCVAFVAKCVGQGHGALGRIAHFTQGLQHTSIKKVFVTVLVVSFMRCHMCCDVRGHVSCVQGCVWCSHGCFLLLTKPHPPGKHNLTRYVG